MFAKVTRGNSFINALKYDDEKQEVHVKEPMLMYSNIPNYQNMDIQEINHFLETVNNKDIKNNCIRISLNPCEHEFLSNEEWEQITERFMQEMKYDNCPFYVVKHTHEEREHVHITIRRTQFDGHAASDSFDIKRAKDACRALEREFLLQPAIKEEQNQNRKAPTQSEIKKAERLDEYPNKMLIQDTLDEFIGRPMGAYEFVQEIEKKGINVNVNIASTGKLNGFSFQVDGDEIKYSSKVLGKAYGLKNLQEKGLRYDNEEQLKFLERKRGLETNIRRNEVPTSSVGNEETADRGHFEQLRDKIDRLEKRDNAERERLESVERTRKVVLRNNHGKRSELINNCVDFSHFLSVHQEVQRTTSGNNISFKRTSEPYKLFISRGSDKGRYKAVVFDNFYNNNMPLSLKDMFIQPIEPDKHCIFRDKETTITDKGDTISLNGAVNKQNAERMVDVCLAKGWKLENIQAKGDKAFIQAMNEEVRERQRLEEEQIKQVDLGAFLESHNFTLDLKNSSRNSLTYRLDDYKLSISKMENGHYMFSDFKNNEHGSIIDFSQKYLGIGNIGEVKKYVREFETKDIRATNQIQVADKANFSDYIYRISEPVKENAYTAHRGLHKATLERYGRNVKVNEYQGKLSMLFAHTRKVTVDDDPKADHSYTYEKVIGFEVKGQNGTFFSKNGTKSFAEFYHKDVNKHGLSRVVITESGIDALSIAELELHRKDTIYLSSGGALSKEQLKELNKYLYKSEIITAFDNDKQGRAFAEQVKSHVTESGFSSSCSVSSLVPTAKDWNEDLINAKMQIYEQQQQALEQERPVTQSRGMEM